MYHEILFFFNYFAVVEHNLENLPYSNFNWIQGYSVDIDFGTKEVKILKNLDDRNEDICAVQIPYDYLCIATGAAPKRLLDSPYVYVIRDTDSVERLAKRLSKAKSVIVVGNGGIALELAYKLRRLNVTWIVRHGHIGDAFFDVDASNFLLDELRFRRRLDLVVSKMHRKHRKDSQQMASSNNENDTSKCEDVNSQDSTKLKDRKYISSPSEVPAGHAVGPTWSSRLPSGTLVQEGQFRIETEAEAVEINLISGDPALSKFNSFDKKDGDSTDDTHLLNSSNCIEVKLSSGEILSADVVISAIGVHPAVEWVPQDIERALDGGIIVNEEMKTNIPCVYAAGDVCSTKFDKSFAPHWFQMRLWTQARNMGFWAAQCMAGISNDTGFDIGFEVFSHVTRFVGKKVVLLGLYNGQGLENEPDTDLVSYTRVTGLTFDQFFSSDQSMKDNLFLDEEFLESRTFIRLLLLRGRVQGAVLIGETDLEETFENLIFDGLDVSQFGPSILDPDIELDHVFD